MNTALDTALANLAAAAARTRELILAGPIAKDTKPVSPRPKNPEWRELYRVMDRHLNGMRNTFLRAVAAVQEATVGKVVREAIDAGDIKAAVKAIPWAESAHDILGDDFMARFGEVVEEAGLVAVDYLPRKASFAIDDPRARNWMAEHGAELIRDLDKEHLTAIRASLVEMLDQGLPANQAQRLIVGQIGLLDREALAVTRMATKLTVAGELSPGQIQKLADQYSERLRLARALRIARTEGQFALSGAQREAWAQAIDQGQLPENGRERFLPGEGACETCLGHAGVYPIGQGPRAPIHPGCACMTVYEEPEGKAVYREAA